MQVTTDSLPPIASAASASPPANPVSQKALAVLERFGDTRRLHDIDGFLRYWEFRTATSSLDYGGEDAIPFLLRTARSTFNEAAEDPEYARYILQRYTQLMAQLPSLRTKPGHLKVIHEIVMAAQRFFGLGAPLISFYDMMIRDLPKPEFNPSDFQESSVRQAVQSFFQAVGDYECRIHPLTQRTPDPRPSILILTELSGGGHIKQARAVEQALGAFFRFEMLLIEDIAYQTDPLPKQPLRYPDNEEVTSSSLYNRLGAHGDRESSTVLQTYALFLRTLFPDFFTNVTKRVIVEKIRRERPDLILINLPHRVLDLSDIAFRTNTATLFMQGDYDFHEVVQKFIALQRGLEEPYRLVSFALPTDHPDFLPAGFSYSDPELYVTGLPASLQFKEESDPSKIAQLRAKYNIRENAQVEVVSRGFLGVTAHLRSCIEDLINSKESLDEPVDVVVICGKNSEAKTLLEELTANYPLPGKNFKFHIHGLVATDVMCEVTQIAKVADIKAGGSTTEEFLQMVASNPNGSVKRAIAVPEYWWERPNSTQLQRAGVAQEYDPRYEERPDRLKLLKEMLADHRPVKPRVMNWTEELHRAINSVLEKHQKQEKNIHG